MVMIGIEVTSIRMLIHTPSTRLLHARMNFESGASQFINYSLYSFWLPSGRGAKFVGLNP